MTKLFRLSACALLAVSVIAGCGSKTPVAPTPPVVVPPTSTPVLAYPPLGLVTITDDPAWWQTAFEMVSNRLYRPVKKTVTQDVSALSKEDQDIYSSQVDMATAVMAGRQQISLTGNEVVFKVTSVETSLTCGAVFLENGACTIFNTNNSGEVIGGTTVYTSVSVIRKFHYAVLHEIFRTLGMNRNGPAKSIMAVDGGTGVVTPEDTAVFQGRYDYLPLAVYASSRANALAFGQGIVAEAPSTRVFAVALVLPVEK